MGPGSFRLFLAFIVMIHHSFPLRLGNWAVGMFFVLSGYWISKMWRKKYSRQPRPYRTFVISRWWRLAPLFVFVQLLGATLVFAGLPVGDPNAVSDVRWWITQPLIVGSTHFARLLPPSWSLNVEMQFYLLAPLIVAWCFSCKRSMYGAILAGGLTWSAVRLYFGATLETPYLDVFAWLFLVGIGCDRFEYRPSKLHACLSGAAILGLVVLILAFPATREFIWRPGSEGVVESVYPKLLFLISTCLGIPAVIYTVYLPSGSFDRWLGDLSYPLYLFHWFTRDWYYSVVDWNRSPALNGLLLLCNFAFAIIGAVALLHLVDRPAQRVREAWLAFVRRPIDANIVTGEVPNRA